MVKNHIITEELLHFLHLVAKAKSPMEPFSCGVEELLGSVLLLQLWRKRVRVSWG